MEDPDDMSARIDYCEQDLHEIMGKPTPEELSERFNYHAPPNDRVVGAHCKVRAACHVAAQALVGTCPEGRELALALTKLEEAMFWGNAAVARNHGHFVRQELSGNPEGELPIVETAPPEEP